jgi:hypothetical protein
LQLPSNRFQPLTAVRYFCAHPDNQIVKQPCHRSRTRGSNIDKVTKVTCP